MLIDSLAVDATGGHVPVRYFTTHSESGRYVEHFFWLVVESEKIGQLGGIMRLHHVQLSMPKGAEDQARLFYSDALGLTEVEKPPSLAGRGGCWFRAFEGTAVVAEIHLGVESGFSPAHKAHPGLVVASTVELEDLATRIQSAGFDLSWEERHTFEGYERFHCRDPFSNRVEVLSRLTL